MTTAADLTPHSWQQPELAVIRAVVLCAVAGRFQRMDEHLDGLNPQAMEELLYGLNVLHPNVRLRVEKAKPMPCPRCGHPEIVHWSAGQARRGCGECATGNCEPVRVPVGVVQAVTVITVDAEDEVE